MIAGLSAGLDFALEYRDEVFPGVPIVFIAVDQREVKARRLPPDVIGVPIRMDLAGTLDLALRLHPTPAGCSWSRGVRRSTPTGRPKRGGRSAPTRTGWSSST